MIDRLIIPLLVAGMLATGTANTLLTKLQDQVCVGNCESPDPTKRHYFEQPVIQTLQMFIGEMGCWLVVGLFYLHQQYLERKNGLKGYEPVGAGLEEAESSRGLNPAVKALVPNSEHRLHLSGRRVFLLALPACCDIAGTTLMNVGLFFVVASIYQMTRGALVLFVGIFSVIFLKRRLRAYQWLALAIVVLGVAVVGLAGALYNEPARTEPEPSTPVPPQMSSVAEVNPAVRTIIGVLLIAGAQIFTATQFVLEEFILEKYALEPLKVVGWEGVFGFLVTTVGMFVLHFMVGVTDAGRGGYFDAAEGWREVSQYPLVAQTSVLIMISIGCFNYFGISVTRSISATARSVIDTCRTLFIWIVSVGLGWESFKWLQVAGFILLVYGTFLFNDLINEPLRSCWLSDRAGKQREREEREENNRGLLQETPVEHI
ncbi:hypothetical protein DFH27DRAFT_567772 [Peziza echinospora]|nr:hypothetical protein DFH27DRAFT_55217 [Peziza echinospora]KAI5793926.1 hypothetical protein DFH27DRAFT_567772 [Peziza echinospora]